MRRAALAALGALALAAGGAAAAGVPASALAELRWRSLGPQRAGWATAVAGVPSQPHVFYFGGAGGGVWKTTDAGNTWRPLMDHERAAAIGAIAVAPSDPRVLYAGTGQEGARYDLMDGEGVFRSRDGGTTWQAAGLADSRRIGALLVDPRDPDRVLAAAIGHAFGPNAERGVFLTSDGGAHWRPVLQAGDSVGAVDLARDDTAPRIVYASLWQHRMRPWLDYFVPQAGPGSGIWRSDDGGEHWARLADGLPGGPLGRIGLAVARGTGGRVVYACVAGAGPRVRGAAPGGPPRAGLFRSADGGAHWRCVNPDGSLADSYFGRLAVAPDDSNTVIATGQSLRRSRDGGAHFEVWRGSPGGDDYHQIWIDPADPSAMIAGSDQGAAVSVNGGATWSSWYNQPTGQFYRLGADDRFPYRVYSGQQDNGTVEIASRGPYGAIEERDWHPVGGDERNIMLPKPGEPDVVFGSGLGGGVSRFDERTRQSIDVAPWPIGSYGARPTDVRYRYGWITPMAISAAPGHALYLGAQLLFRSLDDGDHWQVVSPDLTGAKPGTAPCDDPAPAAGRDCGFGVIACIAPSPLDSARIWVGTDDGLVQLTTDGGAHWRDVTPPAIPAWGIVFTIDPSPLDPATAYAAVDLHRLDRHEPLLLRTHDAGATWSVISGGLPRDEYTSVVRADPVRAGLLYAGTNRSVYVSFDDGGAWQALASGLPTTWMRDLLPHAGDLLLATQGRGLWVLDDVAPLRDLAAGAANGSIALCTPAPAVRLRGSESHDTPWPPETALGENPPTGAVIDYWLGEAVKRPVTLAVRDSTGTVLRRFSSADPAEPAGGEPYFEKAWLRAPRALGTGAGLHRFVWDLRLARPAAPRYGWSIAAVRASGTPLRPAGPLVPPGRYTVVLGTGKYSFEAPLEVRADPRVPASDADLRAQFALARAAAVTLDSAMAAARAITAARAVSPAPEWGDSLAALAAIDGVAGTLAGLADAVGAADTAPPQGLVDAIADSTRRIDGLLARWRALAPRLPAKR